MNKNEIFLRLKALKSVVINMENTKNVVNLFKDTNTENPIILGPTDYPIINENYDFKVYNMNANIKVTKCSYLPCKDNNYFYVTTLIRNSLPTRRHTNLHLLAYINSIDTSILTSSFNAKSYKTCASCHTKTNRNYYIILPQNYCRSAIIGRFICNDCLLECKNYSISYIHGTVPIIASPDRKLIICDDVMIFIETHIVSVIFNKFIKSEKWFKCVACDYRFSRKGLCPKCAKYNYSALISLYSPKYALLKETILVKDVCNLIFLTLKNLKIDIIPANDKT